MDTLAAQIVAQIEYAFNAENLSHDICLRSLMHPVTGWVALAQIVKFSHMVRMGATHVPFVAQALRHSAVVEVDPTGYFIRPRHYPQQIAMLHMLHSQALANNVPIASAAYPHLPANFAGSAQFFNPAPAQFAVYPQMVPIHAPLTARAVPGSAYAYVQQQPVASMAPPPAQPFPKEQQTLVPQTAEKVAHSATACMPAVPMHETRKQQPKDLGNPLFAHAGQLEAYAAQVTTQGKVPSCATVPHAQNGVTDVRMTCGVDEATGMMSEGVPPTVAPPPAISGGASGHAQHARKAKDTGKGRQTRAATEEDEVMMFGDPPVVVAMKRTVRAGTKERMAGKKMKRGKSVGRVSKENSVRTEGGMRAAEEVEIGSEVSSPPSPPDERVEGGFGEGKRKKNK